MATKEESNKMDVVEEEEKLSREEQELMEMSADELIARTRQIETSLRERKSEIDRLNREIANLRGHIKENEDKIQQGKQLPFLVSTLVELVPDCESGIEDAINAGAPKTAPKKKAPEPEKNGALSLKKKSREQEKEELTCAVIKTSMEQTIYLPVIGLVPADELKPGDLIGVNKDTFLILEKLPSEYDSRVKAMEVD